MKNEKKKIKVVTLNKEKIIAWAKGEIAECEKFIKLFEKADNETPDQPN